MIRIGIYGTENSHANAACKAFNTGGKGERIRGAKVVALCPGPGDSLKHAREVAEQGGVEHVVRTLDELVELTDAGIVMNRHGKYHLEGAAAFIKVGKPVFVDKPLTCSVRDAKKLLALADKHGVWISSWSSIWLTDSAKQIKKQLAKIGPVFMGDVFGPFDLKSPYGGHFFYGIHTVELALFAFGYDAKSVSVTTAKSKEGTDLVATLTFKSGAVVNLNLVNRGARGWAVLAWGANGDLYEKIDTSTGYKNSFKLLVRSIQKNERPLTNEQLLMPVRILEAIDKALKSRRAVKV